MIVLFQVKNIIANNYNVSTGTTRPLYDVSGILNRGNYVYQTMCTYAFHKCNKVKYFEKKTFTFLGPEWRKCSGVNSIT